MDLGRWQGQVPPVPVSEEDEFLSMLKQQANILHQLQQQRGLAPVCAAAPYPLDDETFRADLLPGAWACASACFRFINAIRAQRCSYLVT